MTERQHSALLAAGWTVVKEDLWAHPLTRTHYSDRQALALLALKPRARHAHQPTLYRRR